MESDSFQSSDTLDGTMANNRNHLNLSVNTSVPYPYPHDANQYSSQTHNHSSSDEGLFVPQDSPDGNSMTGLTPESERTLPKSTLNYQSAPGSAQQMQGHFNSSTFGTGQPGSGVRSQFDGPLTPESPVSSHAHPQQSLENLQTQYEQTGLFARGQTPRGHQQRTSVNQERASRQNGPSRQQYQQHLQSGYQVNSQSKFHQQRQRRQSVQYPQVFGQNANLQSFSNVSQYGPPLPSTANTDVFVASAASSQYPVDDSGYANPYGAHQSQYPPQPQFTHYEGPQLSDLAHGLPIVAGADPDPYHARARELLDVYQIPTIPYLGKALQPLCWASVQAPLSLRAVGEDHDMWIALIDHVFREAQQSLCRLPNPQREPSLGVLNQAQLALKHFVGVVRHERVQITNAYFARQQGRQPNFTLMPEPSSEAGQRIDLGALERQTVEKEVQRQRRLANQDREVERGRSQPERATKRGAKQHEPIIRQVPSAAGADPGPSTARAKFAQPVKSEKGKERQVVTGIDEHGEDGEYEDDDFEEDEEDGPSGQARGKAPNGRNWYLGEERMPGLPELKFDPAIVASTGTDMAKIVNPNSYEGGQEGINRVIKTNGSSKIKRTVSPSGADGAGPAKRMRAGRKPPPSATEGVPISRNFAESLHGAYTAMPVIHSNVRGGQ